MAAMLLQLSLCILTVIQLTSSQSTHDVILPDNDVSSCGGIEQVLGQLVRAVSQLQTEVKALSGNKDASGRPRTRECPADFTYMTSVNGCYKVINRKLTWYSAGLACRLLHKDAHLIIINDVAEQHEIARMIDSANEAMLAGCTGRSLWTAGQRIDPNSNSTFVWRVNTNSDTVTLMKYVNWHPGEPNYLGQQESCMLFSGRLWNDGNCNHAFCSVCEIDMNT